MNVGLAIGNVKSGDGVKVDVAAGITVGLETAGVCVTSITEKPGTLMQLNRKTANMSRIKSFVLIFIDCLL
ncbi:MAG: hypothetical protein DCC56_05160 [Anaerolineae bacterium]|nr:MAG: hypothetical protein DCC56_05160 [Anaerolineae bacterium]